MPKNAGRSSGTSRNFDPSSRYARGSKVGSHSKPGSRSQGHRGYRPADEVQNEHKKPRWTAQQRADRGLNADRRARPGREDDRYDRQAHGRGQGGAQWGGYDRKNQRGSSRRGEDGGSRSRSGRDMYSRDRFDNNDRGARGTRAWRADTSAEYTREDRDSRQGGGRFRFARDDRADQGRSGSGFGGGRESFRDRDGRRQRGGSGARWGRDRDRDHFGERGFSSGGRGFDRDSRPPRGFAHGERAAYRDRSDSGGHDSRGSHENGASHERGVGRGSRPDDHASSFYPTKTNGSRQRDTRDDEVLERLQAEATLAADVEGVSFEVLGLGPGIVRTLETLGAETPFPIQAATIPDVLSGRDVLGRGRTGSGKTIAFAAPVVELLLRTGSAEIAEGKRAKRQQGRSPRALILAPTRELALQIDRTVQPIARAVGLFTTQVYGGVPQRAQVVALERGVDIVVGTPGRVEDLHDQGRLDLSQVQLTVLDEADHMCDLGFLEPVQRILRLTAEGGQRLLFSATLDTGVAALVDEFLTDPAVHEVAGEDQASGTIIHRVFVIDHREKLDVIRALADRDAKTLIFARTRSYAEDLADALEDEGIPAVSLHGDLNQSRRTRNLEKLTKGRVNVLVATDVAARGIHVDDIDLVIQADAPDEYKTYLHRSGRTGRAGKAGTVVTLVSRGRTRRMRGLLERAEIEAEWSEVIPETAASLVTPSGS